MIVDPGKLMSKSSYPGILQMSTMLQVLHDIKKMLSHFIFIIISLSYWYLKFIVKEK